MAETSAIRLLQDLGINISNTVLEAIKKESGADQLSATDLLLETGMGDYDYDTGVWTPRSDKVYAFDAEVFDIEHMYTLFLNGVQTIIPDIKITDISEDLSGMTEELTDSEDGMSPPTDGMRSVRFICNGHEYSFELASCGDWFNNEMFGFMDRVLEAENCPHKLYEFPAACQCVILYYGDEAVASQLSAVIEPF